MASKVGYSSKVGLKDIIRAWSEFEKSENTSIVMELMLNSHKPPFDVIVRAKSTPNEVKGQEARQSVSTSATCSAMRVQTLEALVFRVLYVLDFQSAAQEYRAHENPEA